MTIDDVLKLAQARLAWLSGQLASAEAIGDVAAMTRLAGEIADTEQTIAQLTAVQAS